MTTKNTSAKSSTANKPAVIIFGLDQAGKPKAGRFTERHATAARKAAKALKLAVCAINRPEIVELVAKIPVGRLHAQGKAFIPYIKRELFEQLQIVGSPARSRAAAAKPGPAVQALPSAKPPKDWDSIGEGDLVLYSEGRLDGWWEAIVQSRETDTLILKYRDFPKLPSFRCHFRSVALNYLETA